MGSSARQLILDLLARDKTGPASSSAAKNMDKVGDSAQGAAKSAEKLGKESDKADEKVDGLGKSSDRAEDQVQRFGKSSRSAGEHVEHLNHEIDLCEHELHKLAVAFAEAKTAAERADLSKGIRATQRELRELNKSKGLLGGLIPKSSDVEDEGSKLGKELGKSITGGLKDIPVGPALGAAAAAAAPAIGAVISAAVIGGAGVGGVIGGVLLASKDPRVKSAGSQLGQSLLGQLQKDADVFVDPILDNIAKIESRFKAMNGTISGIFKGSSGFLGPLVDGSLDAVAGILRGVNSLISKGKPVIDAFGKTFSILGDSVGDALTIISGDSEDSASALLILARATGEVIKGVAWVVRGLTELYGVISYLPSKFQDLEFAVVGWNRSAEDTVSTGSALAAVQRTLSTTVLSAGEAAGKAGQQMQTYGDKMDDAAAKGKSLYDSQTAVAQAVADAQKALKENGKTLDINSQKGRDNRVALSGVAAGLKANYDAYVKVNGEGRNAQGVAQNNRAAFQKLATQFGLSKKAAADLATEMGLIPAKKTATFYANTHDAQARLDALKSKIRSVKGKTVTVHVSVTGTERLDEAGHRIGGFRAAGGPVRKGSAYIVGEKRPEVFVPNTDGTIIPSISGYATGGAGTAGVSAGGGSGSGGWVSIRGDAVIDALIKLIAERVSDRGGGAAQLGIRKV